VGGGRGARPAGGVRVGGVTFGGLHNIEILRDFWLSIKVCHDQHIRCIILDVQVVAHF
jgi:hypothetical protein